MSQLSQEIHAQELLARSVCEELSVHAQTVRRLSGTSWESSAGETFRRSLDHLSRQIVACQDESEELTAALAEHARQVGVNEQSVLHFLYDLEKGVEHLGHDVTEGAKGFLHRVEQGAASFRDDIVHGAESLGRGLHAIADEVQHPHPPTSDVGRTVMDARSPW